MLIVVVLALIGLAAFAVISAERRRKSDLETILKLMKGDKDA